MPSRWSDRFAWALALAVTGAGAWLRWRGVTSLDLQGDELTYVGASFSDALGLEGLLFYAPLRPLLTFLALAVDPGVVALRALGWLPGVVVPLAFFALFRPVAGPWPALAAAACLAFDEGQAWTSVVGLVYALVILLQIVALAAHRRVVAGREPAGALPWAVASALLLLAHYLMLPFVLLTAVTGTLAVRAAGSPELSRAWRRALVGVGAVALPVGALLAFGLTRRFLLAASAGLPGMQAVAVGDLLGLNLVPFGVFRPPVNVVVAAVALAGGLLAVRRAAAPLAHWLGFLVVLVAAIPFVPRIQAMQLFFLHVPLLALLLEAAAPLAERGPGVRLPLSAAALGVTGLAAVVGLGLGPFAGTGWITGNQPPYAPLHELAATLAARPDLPPAVVLHPPGQMAALALARRPALDLEPCTDRVDDGGVQQEIACPEGTVVAAWPTDDRRRIAWPEPPAGPWLAAVEKVKVWNLEGRWPESPAWSAPDVPPAALGLPASCRPVAALQWLLYRCP